MFGFQDWVFFDGLDGAIEVGELSFELFLLLWGLDEFLAFLLLFISIFRFAHRIISTRIDHSIAVDDLFGDGVVELLDSGLGKILGFGWSSIEKVL